MPPPRAPSVGATARRNTGADESLFGEVRRCVCLRRADRVLFRGGRPPGRKSGCDAPAIIARAPDGIPCHEE
jgi:hypothetical protein